jgi:hypothetical protein
VSSVTHARCNERTHADCFEFFDVISRARLALVSARITQTRASMHLSRRQQARSYGKRNTPQHTHTHTTHKQTYTPTHHTHAHIYNLARTVGSCALLKAAIDPKDANHKTLVTDLKTAKVDSSAVGGSE